MTTGTPELQVSPSVRLTREEPLPMEGEIMNILQTLQAGEQASSQGPGLARSTVEGMPDMPAEHPSLAADRNTQHQLLE